VIPANAILDQLKAQALAEIDLTGSGSAPGIVDTLRQNVFITEVPWTVDRRDRFKSFPRPSLIFSLVKTNAPLEAGDNQKAVVFYTVVAQVLDTEFDMLATTDKSAARQKWEQNIRRYVHTGNLQDAVFDTSDGMVTLAFVGNIDQLDEKLLHARDDGVVTIPIVFKCWEPHDTNGRA
jgi:hypothetical protein